MAEAVASVSGKKIARSIHTFSADYSMSSNRTWSPGSSGGGSSGSSGYESNARTSQRRRQSSQRSGPSRARSRSRNSARSGPATRRDVIDLTMNSSDDERAGTGGDTVTNMITFEDIPRRFALQIDQQWYDPMALSKWVRSRGTIPHTRQQATPEQRNAIARGAAAWAWHQGKAWPPREQPRVFLPQGVGAARTAPRVPPQPQQARPQWQFWRGIDSARKAPPRPTLPDQPNRPVYFRRHVVRSRGAAPRFKYYKAIGAQTAFALSRDMQTWVPMPAPRSLNYSILISSPSRVDVSMDFVPGSGAGHWQQLRHRDDQIDRWSRGEPRHSFYNALRHTLHPTFSHMWTGFT